MELNHIVLCFGAGNKIRFQSIEGFDASCNVDQNTTIGIAGIIHNFALIKDITITVVGKLGKTVFLTKEEAEANKEAISDEILTRIQELYDSTFIVDVVFTGWNLS